MVAFAENIFPPQKATPENAYPLGRSELGRIGPRLKIQDLAIGEVDTTNETNRSTTPLDHHFSCRSID